MWFSSDQPKTHIAEANRHLIALTDKVDNLEQLLAVKEAELKKKEDDFTEVMRDVHHKRQEEIKDLNELIFKQNLKLQRLEKDLVNRDSELSVLRRRCRMLDEILRYKATLAKLTITLEQAEQYASLTGLSRNYTFSQSNDLINTEPSPLKLCYSDREQKHYDADSIEDGTKNSSSPNVKNDLAINGCY